MTKYPIPLNGYHPGWHSPWGNHELTSYRLCILLALLLVAFLAPASSQDYESYDSDQLREMLQSAEPGARFEALRFMTSEENDADPELAPLLRRLAHDADPAVRGQVLVALGRMDNAKDLPLITAGLRDPHVLVRSQAVDALGCLTAPEARRVLLGLLNDKRSPLCRDAIIALKAHADSGLANPLLTVLNDADPALRAAVVEVLDILLRQEVEKSVVGNAWMESPLTKSIIPRLRALKDDNDADVRLAAVQAISQQAFFPGSAEWLQQLASDPDGAVRAAALIGLCQSLAQDKLDPLLMKALQDPEPEVRAVGVYHLNVRRPENLAAVLACGRDAEVAVRLAVLRRIEQITANALVAVPEAMQAQMRDLILAGLTDADTSLHAVAIKQAQRLPDPRMVEPLIALLDTADAMRSDYALRFSVEDIAEALHAINDTRAVPVLMAAFRAADENTQDRYLTALGAIDQPEAFAAFATIMDAITDDGTRRRMLDVLAQGAKTETRVAALAAYLTAADDSLRLRAAHYLASSGKVGVPYLLAAIDSNNPGARDAAFDMLLLLDDEKSVALLADALLHANARVRAAAALALNRHGDARALPELRNAMASDDERIRFAALAALAQAKDPHALDTLVEMAQDPIPGTANWAATLLVNYRDPRVLPILTDRLARTENSGMRQNLLNALMRIDDPRATRLLLDNLAVLAQDLDPLNANWAVELLARYGDARAMPALLERLATTDDIDIRHEILRTVLRIDDPRATQLLLAELDTAEAEWRATLVAALLHSKDPAGGEGLVAQLRATMSAKQLPEMITFTTEQADDIYYDDIEGERDQTEVTFPIFLLQQSLRGKGPLLTAPFIAGLQDPRPEIRAALLCCLCNSRDERLTMQVLPLLSDKDAVVRMLACRRVTQAPDIRALAPLCALLKDADKQVREAALGALWRLQDRRAVPALLAEAQAGKYDVIALLAELHDPRAAETLLRVVQRQQLPEWQREYAIMGLAAIAGQLKDQAELRNRIITTLRPIAGKLTSTLGQQALRALGAYGDADSLPRILNACNDRRYEMMSIGFHGLRAYIDATNTRDQRVIDTLIILARMPLDGERGELGMRIEAALARYTDIPRVAEALAAKQPIMAPLPPLETLLERLNTLQPSVNGHHNNENAQLCYDLRRHLEQNPTCAAQMAAPLLNALKRADDNARRDIEYLLTQVNDPAVIALFVNRLTVSQQEPRFRAILALGVLKASTAVESLLPLLTGDDAFCKYAALFALWQIGEKTGAQQVLPLLHDQDATTRHGAARLLARMGCLDAVEPLIDQARQGDVMAIEALGDLHDTRATEVLTALLQDPPPATRVMREKIRQWHGESYLNQLDLHFFSNDNGIRITAATALGKIDDPRAIPALIAALDMGTPQDRQAAAEALALHDDPRIPPALQAYYDTQP